MNELFELTRIKEFNSVTEADAWLSTCVGLSTGNMVIESWKYTGEKIAIMYSEGRIEVEEGEY